MTDLEIALLAALCLLLIFIYPMAMANRRLKADCDYWKEGVNFNAIHLNAAVKNLRELQTECNRLQALIVLRSVDMDEGAELLADATVALKKVTAERDRLAEQLDRIRAEANPGGVPVAEVDGSLI